MNKKSEYLIDLIFNKLKKYKTRTINLEKEELRKFINFLIKNS